MQGELCGGSESVRRTGGGADGYALPIWIDVGNWSGGRKVVIGGSRIGDSKV